MNADEYANLERVEKEHWFYRGKREIVRTWLRRYGQLTPKKLLVDCGAGTGRFALETGQFCAVKAIDDHAESLEIARRLLGPERVAEGSCNHLPLPDAHADVVTALDVIEHVEDDAGAVREMARILKPGGLMVITVPAFMALWSDWDVVLHHFRRYRRQPLEDRLREAGLEILVCQYINVLAFPTVLALRKWRSRRGATEITKAPGERAEEKLPPRWMNTLLRWLFVAPACQKVVRFPFGVGLLAVARKPGGDLE